MAVVVGYVPTREGRAALRRAAEESLLRHSRLVVINSSRGGKDFDAEEAVRFEAELKTIEGRLDAAGVDHEVRQLVRGNEPVRGPHRRRRGGRRRVHRHRPAPPHPGRQADPRLQRPADPARCLLPGPGRQGGRRPTDARDALPPRSRRGSSPPRRTLEYVMTSVRLTLDDARGRPAQPGPVRAAARHAAGPADAHGARLPRPAQARRAARVRARWTRAPSRPGTPRTSPEICATPPAVHRYPAVHGRPDPGAGRAPWSSTTTATPRPCGPPRRRGRRCAPGSRRCRASGRPRPPSSPRSWASSSGCGRPGGSEASAPYGEAGSFRSVADVVDHESLLKVRETKQAAKAGRAGRGR